MIPFSQHHNMKVTAAPSSQIIRPAIVLMAFFSLWIFLPVIYCQPGGDLLNRTIHLVTTEASIGEILTDLTDNQKIYFSFDPGLIPLDRKPAFIEQDQSLGVLLSQLFKGIDIKYTVVEDMIVLSRPNRYTISGFVEDAETGERLIGANIIVSNTGKGTISNNYGFFSLTLSEGDLLLKISYVGYKSIVRPVLLQKDTTVLFRLESGVEIEEVVITSYNNSEEIRSSSISVNRISVKSMESLPSLLGEADVLKMLEFLPGVQFGSEASSGIVVRGGSPEQNLILLDGVPIYNSNHAFGLFSVFNSDAIKSLSLFKGGFPARYGGRLSSVIDVRMKEGNTREFHGNVNIGTIASKFTLEGPVIKNRSSFLLSARRTYVDLLLPASFQSKNDIPEFYFYDINAKINTRISENDRIFLSFYMGHDQFKEEDLFTEEDGSMIDNEINKGIWGNRTLLARWNHIYSKKLFSNLSVLHSDYGLTIDLFEEDEYNHIYESSSAVYHSGITDLSVNLDFDYYPVPNHKVKFGTSYFYHTFNTGELDKHTVEYEEVDGTKIFNPTGNVDETMYNDPVYASEFQAFLEDDFSLGENWYTNVGLHFSGFIVDDANYFSLEPRFSTSYSLSDRFAIKGAYSRMKQYLHLMTHSGMGLPTDLWLPVTSIVKPQYSNQYTLGFVSVLNESYKLTIETYYKALHQIYAYREGVDYLAADNSWETNIELGTGSSYGIEFMLSRTLGKLGGWITYTYSKTERQFETINNGEPFPYKYDRTHQINLVSTYAFNPHLSLNATWIYATGMAYTLSTEKYVSLYRLYNWNMPPGGTTDYIDEYESRNNARMPDYHRLDLSLSYRKQFKRLNTIWNLSIYNVYNRFNPYLIYWDNDVNDDNRRKQKQVALFTVIPSFSIRFEF